MFCVARGMVPLDLHQIVFPTVSEWHFPGMRHQHVEDILGLISAVISVALCKDTEMELDFKF